MMQNTASKIPIAPEIIIETAQWQETIPNVEEFTHELCEATVAYIFSSGQYAPLEVSIVLSHNTLLQSLNLQYRQKDNPTNVLSFPQHPVRPGYYAVFQNKTYPMSLGDVILSFEMLQKEAEEQRKLASAHFAHLLVHGLLHLLGFDHETEEEAAVMERHEIVILQQFGISSPYEESAKMI